LKKTTTVLVSTLRVNLLAYAAFLVVLTLGLAPTAGAQTSKDGGEELAARAADLFEKEQFAAAYPLYSQLVSLKPNDPDYNFRFGATSLYAGVPKETAIKHLTFAIKKGCADYRVQYYLGKAYHLNYDFAKATEAYTAYLAKVGPKDKNPLPAATNLRMCGQGARLLTNIRDVVVLEKTRASVDDFFRYYNLEEIGGRVLRTPDALLSKYDQKMGLVSVIHYPNNALTIYFTSYGKDGKTGKDLYRADLLAGGEFSAPQRLPDVINTPEDEDFAFMHPDGKTFYFASRGHNSMGGYDIFKSIYDRNTDSFSQPVNLDFAINTPDDDLFYVVDSLGQTAYFASGRNSAQGDLNVYKVLVKSIPVNLMFIAGTYKPEAPGVDVRANIIISDELTGKPILETSADATANGYILELPKPGKYKIEVMPKGGAVRHSGVFTVPVYDQSVALAQELRIINENGVEKLIITNRFEDPLDINLAELAADGLRRRAGLDVNATADRMKEAEQQQDEEGSLREDIKKDDLIVLAGFDQSIQLSTVVEEIAQLAEEQARIENRAKEHAARLISEATLAQAEASKGMMAAEALMQGVSKDDRERYVSALKEYNTVLAEAQRQQRIADNAFAASRRLHTSEVELKTATSRRQAENAQLQESLRDGNLETALTVLTNHHQEKTQGGKISLPAAVEVERELIEKSRAIDATKQRIEALDEERSAALTRRKQVQRELDATSKKNTQTQLQLELERIDDEVNGFENDLYERRQILVQLNQEQQDLIAQQQILSAAGTENVVENYAPFDPLAANALAGMLEASRQRLIFLEIEDDETLALLDPEAERRRVSVELLPTLSAKAVALNLDLKPVLGLRTDYTAALAGLADRGVSPDAQADALRSIELMRVDEQVRFLQSVELKTLSPDELAWRDRELSEALTYQKELQNSRSSITPIAAIEPQLAEQILRDRYPAATLSTQPNSQNEGDLAQWQKRIDQINETQALIDADIKSTHKAIVASDDAAEVESLIRDQQQLIQLKAHLSSETSVQDIQIAWENDQRSIIEEDANFKLKTQQQIELATAYISTLEQVIDGYTRSNQPREDDVKRVNEQIELAKVKLANYQSDLALSLSVSAPNDKANVGVNTTTSNQSISNVDVQALSSLELTQEMSELTGIIDDPMREEERDLAQARIAEINNEIDARNQNQLVEIERGLAIVNVFELSALRPDELAGFNTLVAALRSDESFQKAQQTIEQRDADIERVDETLESETSQGKIKKLDRERESIYAQRAEAEVERALAASAYIEEVYTAQQELIKLGWQETSLTNDQRALVGTHLAIEQRKAEQAIEEATTLRRENEKERDAIKKGAAMNEALALELAALAVQKRLLNLIQAGDQLNVLSNEQLALVLSGDLLLSEAVNKQSISEVTPSVAEETAVTQSSNNSPVALSSEPPTEQVATNSSSAKENQTVAATEAASNTSSTIAESDITSSDAISTPEKQNVAEARVADLRTERANLPEAVPSIEVESTVADAMLSSQALVLDVTRDQPMSAEAVSQLYNSEAIARYEEQSTAINVLFAERRALAEIRNGAAADYAKVNERIEKLESAFLASTNLAEQEGLKSEIQALYRNAEVRYEEVQEADERLAEKDAEIEERAAEIRNIVKQVNVEAQERLASLPTNESTETKRQSEPLQSAATVNSTAISTGEVSENTAELASSTATSLAVRSTAARPDISSYLFALPEVLIESVFSLTEQPVYSSSQPIPLDLPMPSGIVYKVQVGAFRNPIPQDHFNRFAPLAGERLENGITRYTAGVFVDFTTADDAKRSIRELGYRDAFVVAYRDGKRINLNAAQSEQGGLASTAISTSPIPSVTSTTADVSPSNQTSNAGVNGSVGTAGDSTELIAATSPSRRQAENQTASTAVVPLPDFAGDWRDRKGTYYTVQVGVYSRPVSLADLYNVSDIMAEVLSNGMVRYTTGVYANLESAQVRREEARVAGISDAFITTYVDGKRVAVTTLPATSVEPIRTQEPAAKPQARYQVQIGGFTGQVPAGTARALLMLESTWGIYQVKRGQETLYLTRKMITRAEADRAIEEFEEQGAEKVTIVE
jgi:predicted  nucleic acid-binding Zn-ribbon protein